MKSLRYTLIASMALLFSGCATQPYTAQHANTGQLSEIRDLHVVSIIPQRQLETQQDALYLNTVPVGAVTGAALAGGLLGGMLISAEANHEAAVFAEKHVKPLQKVLTNYDGRAAIRQTLENGIHSLPVRVGDWKTIDAQATDADLLPADAVAGSAWLLLRTSYAMTPDFSGLQVVTLAKLYVANTSVTWRHAPAYQNTLIYQSALMKMPPKNDVERQRMTAAENARYAKLDVDAQIAQVNAATDAYDPGIALKRQKILNEQWQHQATLKQIAAPEWSVDERADWYVSQFRAGHGAVLKQDLSDGGMQTARMLTLDITQPQPVAGSKTDWRTVYQDAQRTIQDAPDGTVYSVANGDVTHGATQVNSNIYISPAHN